MIEFSFNVALHGKHLFRTVPTDDKALSMQVAKELAERFPADLGFDVSVYEKRSNTHTHNITRSL
jgi:hypothetical protein